MYSPIRADSKTRVNDAGEYGVRGERHKDLLRTWGNRLQRMFSLQWQVAVDVAKLADLEAKRKAVAMARSSEAEQQQAGLEAGAGRAAERQKAFEAVANPKLGNLGGVATGFKAAQLHMSLLGDLHRALYMMEAQLGAGKQAATKAADEDAGAGAAAAAASKAASTDAAAADNYSGRRSRSSARGSSSSSSSSSPAKGGVYHAPSNRIDAEREILEWSGCHISMPSSAILKDFWKVSGRANSHKIVMK